MNKPIVIAIDAMGGDNAPKKIIDGIELYQQKNKNVFYKLFGDKNSINNSLKNKKINKQSYEIFHTENNIKGEVTVVISEKKENSKNLDYLDESDKKKIKKLIKNFSLKDIASLISEEKNISKKLIYNYCLKLKNEK